MRLQNFPRVRAMTNLRDQSLVKAGVYPNLCSTRRLKNVIQLSVYPCPIPTLSLVSRLVSRVRKELSGSIIRTLQRLRHTAAVFSSFIVCQWTKMPPHKSGVVDDLRSKEITYGTYLLDASKRQPSIRRICRTWSLISTIGNRNGRPVGHVEL